jgi:CRP-like cAMP-binding protein
MEETFERPFSPPPVQSQLATAQSANRLLQALDPVDLRPLVSDMREVNLSSGAVLQQQGTEVENIYFPLSVVVSLITIMENGALVETASIGWEGAVGVFAGRGPCRAFSHAIAQVPGKAVAIKPKPFQLAVNQSASLRNLVMRYKEAQLAEIQQTAACNALHPLEARVARWLLQILDRVRDPELPLTQESIARMLGVRRTSVTLIAKKLQRNGLIKYHRGRIAVRDRVGLEETACECYRTICRAAEAFLAEHADG